MDVIKLTVYIYKDEEFYTAQCLENGVATFGRTVSEAKRMIREALELYYEDDEVAADKQQNREVHTLKLEYA